MSQSNAFGWLLMSVFLLVGFILKTVHDIGNLRIMKHGEIIKAKIISVKRTSTAMRGGRISSYTPIFMVDEKERISLPAEGLRSPGNYKAGRIYEIYYWPKKGRVLIRQEIHTLRSWIVNVSLLAAAVLIWVIIILI